jgi:RND family efflux transporter MFP subunit
MSEEKKIVIRLPKIELRSLLNRRVYAILASLALFAFWYTSIHPYLSLSNGHLEAFTIPLCSDTTGRIVELNFQEGDFVKKGQSLFTLDHDQLLGKQAQTKQTLSTLNAKIEQEKERLGKAMEGYVIATAELEAGTGSQEIVKNQLALMEEAQENTEKARKQFDTVKAELNSLDHEMQKRTFGAPFDGVILARSKHPGSAIQLGEIICQICDPQRLWIEAEIPEEYLSRISIGTPATIALPAFPKKALQGKVTWIGPSANPTHRIPLRLSVEGKDLSLKPGLTAHVKLKLH